eukprot:TRINITY_DN18757_c0_g1_i1.p1 TRINITY_DN18757_c0_g1~~TRINITY_DN18757_c0_g1_i1.p1  ORF type:complete len:203 (-),score=38.24 TRINITY_DN18757_c0_g1_i1:70-678(-)
MSKRRRREASSPTGFSDDDQDFPEDEDRKSGRRKINIEYIDDKNRRNITFSKRKAGIMKKAYELSTLTGSQVLILVASENGRVFTFATTKLKPLTERTEGRQLIRELLSRPESEADEEMEAATEPVGLEPVPVTSLPSNTLLPQDLLVPSLPDMPEMPPMQSMPSLPPFPLQPPNEMWDPSLIPAPAPVGQEVVQPQLLQEA